MKSLNISNTDEQLALFDFDGTLTKKDSLADFIIFVEGYRKFILGMIMLSPVLLKYVLGFIDNNSAKQRVLKYFFSGFEVKLLLRLGKEYSQSRIPKILRVGALDRIYWHLKEGHDVVIVSASAGVWLKAWADDLHLDLIATELEQKNGFFTGNYFGNNCHGDEKVARIKKKYNLKQYDKIYAYGDSSGDAPMLLLAHEAYYKYFK